MNVKRIYPESKTGLINWIEENFHEIDEFVFQSTMKDGTGMFVYDAYNVISTLGMLELAKGTTHEIANNGEFKFKPKKKEVITWQEVR